MVAFATEAPAQRKLKVPVDPINVIPTQDWIIIRLLDPDESPGGIAIPKTAEVGPPKAVVVAVGPGRQCEYDPNELFPMACEPGDVVRCASIGGVNFVIMDLPGGDHRMIKDYDVCGFVAAP